MDIHGYRDLTVWQKGMDLADAVYDLTLMLPDDERFGLRTQMNRDALSIPSNIAEGYGRMHRRAYANHASIARGSTMELQTQIEFTVRRNMLTRQQITPAWQLTDEVARMLTTLILKLRQPPPPKP